MFHLNLIRGYFFLCNLFSEKEAKFSEVKKYTYCHIVNGRTRTQPGFSDSKCRILPYSREGKRLRSHGALREVLSGEGGGDEPEGVRNLRLERYWAGQQEAEVALEGKEGLGASLQGPDPLTCPTPSASGCLPSPSFQSLAGGEN